MRRSQRTQMKTRMTLRVSLAVLFYVLCEIMFVVARWKVFGYYVLDWHVLLYCTLHQAVLTAFFPINRC